MDILRLFRRSGKGSTSSETRPGSQAAWLEEGVRLRFDQELVQPTLEGLLDAIHGAGPQESVLGAYVAQLVSEGHCRLDTNGATIPWHVIYELLASPEHQGALRMLELPPIASLRPILDGSGTLSGADFDLEISGWCDEAARPVRIDKLEGGVVTLSGEPQLLQAAAWRTLSELEAFRHRGKEARAQHEQELAWGRIRELADQAGALYASPYLETTLVITPERLRLPMSVEETPFGRVRTVMPTFEGAPDGWLKAFDGYNSVQPHYDLTRGGGRVRLVISEPVRRVLEVIKREMPGRQVAGSRAERFLHNPYAFLGEAAHEVIRQEDFEADRAAAGPVDATFSIVGRIEQGRVNRVDLMVTEHLGGGQMRTDTKAFRSAEDLQQFLQALQAALEQERKVFAWGEFDLAIDGESTVQLEQGRQLAHLWRTQPDERIELEDVFELAGYSSRIEGIGTAKPVYVPVIQVKRKDAEAEEGWVPTEITPMVKVNLPGGGQVMLPLDEDQIGNIERAAVEAKAQGKDLVETPSLPTPMPHDKAVELVTQLRSLTQLARKAEEEVSTGSTAPKEGRRQRQTLLIKTNFHGVDYVEERLSSLVMPVARQAELPLSLRPSIGLKSHQLHGVAWMQHLVSKAPGQCRGALLADDMGLGKTLQLLTVLAWYYERNPNAAPSMIIAPKTLLENWANEARKFFNDSFPEVLVLYGDALRQRKQPADLIDLRLREKGIVELLKPGWAGTSKVIITSYDVLVSYEFSLAKQPLAFAICDEAQRIKTPGTLVTKAAKELKPDFRVICTGTPVENSLVDLWCLFDLVQPGLLGALEEFSRSYRRPIECSPDDEQQKQALQRLQALIAPQTLRRTKADIAADLPRKLFAAGRVGAGELEFKETLEPLERLEIELTAHQRVLYKGGLQRFRAASGETDSRKRVKLTFGVLHHMRAVCAEPYCLPGTKFIVDKAGRKAHLENSPKLRWLLDRLTQLHKAGKGEKAIIFTELREVQAALYYFVRETFDLRPFIINGESQDRQTYIDKFSAKAGFDVIILSTLAAGAGLNITAANHVFHFTRAWNPSKEAQATDRAYRIGQEKDVYVYCPTVVADFKTFEVNLDEMLRRKEGLAGATLDDGGLTAMLNGPGDNVTFKDLVRGEVTGEAVPVRFLTMDDVDRMDGISFEVLCCLLWGRQAYLARMTPKGGGDGGIDIVAIKGSEGELLQCKSSKSSDIGWDAVKEVTAGAARYQARFRGTALKKVAVTNQRFTKGAIEQAQANQVDLVERGRFEEILGSHPITNHELDDALQEWALREDADSIAQAA
jgi:HJR/Mrr/RecB family endonuclease